MRITLFSSGAVFFLATATQVMSQPLCFSYAGEQVPYLFDFNLSDVGMASRDHLGRPFIIINPGILSQFPQLAQSFWFYHECAHHALPLAMNNETNADCYAVRHMRNTGQIDSPADVNDMLLAISQLPGSYWGHLPGPARAQNLWACINF